MSKKDKNTKGKDPLIFKDSKHKYKSRRDFLSAGVLTCASTVLMPDLLSMSYKNAQAQDFTCNPIIDTGGNAVSYYVLDAAGGATLANGWPSPTNSSGKMEAVSEAGSSDYVRYGMTGPLKPTMDMQYKTNSRSPFYYGLVSILGGVLHKGAPAHNFFDIITSPIRNGDDTDSNPQNPVAALSSIMPGSLVGAIGNGRSPSTRGNSVSPPSFDTPSLQAKLINKIDAGAGLLKVGYNLDDTSFLNQNSSQFAERIQGLFSRIQRMSKTKVDSLSSLKPGDRNVALLQDVLGCSVGQAQQALNTFGASVLNPETHSDAGRLSILKETFDLEDGAEFSNNDSSLAGIMYLVANGYASAGTHTIGGCDYHDNTASRGAAKKFEIGQALGRIIKYHLLLGKPAMISLMSDGAARSNNAQKTVDLTEMGGPTDVGMVYVTDFGEGANLVNVFINPNKAASDAMFNDDKRCLGRIKAQGGSDLQGSIFANNIPLAVKLMMAMYGQFATDLGAENFLNSITPWSTDRDNAAIAALVGNKIKKAV